MAKRFHLNVPNQKPNVTSARWLPAGLNIALLICLFLTITAPAQARGPWRANAENTRGWQLMTPEERITHQARIRSFRNYAECHTYQREHHAVMVERAKERGLQLAGEAEHRDICAHLQTTDSNPQ